MCYIKSSVVETYLYFQTERSLRFDAPLRVASHAMNHNIFIRDVVFYMLVVVISLVGLLLVLSTYGSY
jgi:hypothetical protein